MIEQYLLINVRRKIALGLVETKIFGSPTTNKLMVLENREMTKISGVESTAKQVTHAYLSKQLE